MGGNSASAVLLRETSIERADAPDPKDLEKYQAWLNERFKEPLKKKKLSRRRVRSYRAQEIVPPS